MAPPNSNHFTTDPEYIDLLNYLITRTEDVESPINITKLAREFKQKIETLQTVDCLKQRIEKLRRRIQGFEHIDTGTKVKMLFALSASVNPDFLKELKKTALVVVDKKERIIQYKATDGSLELIDQSRLEKHNNGSIGLKGSHQSLITNYFENKNDAVAVPKNKKEKEMWNLIEFITRKCGTVGSPLSITQLTKDFNNHFRVSRSAMTIRTRIKAYCNEIQGIESLDTLTKIKQLFCLSARLDSDFLQKLRKDAVVEVDDLNRITKYTANNGRFSLHGDHSQTAKSKLAWIEWDEKRNTVKKHCNSDVDENMESEKEYQYSEKDSDEREGSGRELHSENEDEYSNHYQVKLEPFRGSIKEDLSEIKEDEDIQQIPKPLQAHDEHNQIEEVPIKIEIDEPIEIKPKTSHNSKIKFFEAMHSLILCLDTPILSDLQSKIHQKIQQLGGQNDVILNEEIVLNIEILISRMTNDSVVNLSEAAESVNLSNFLCYLKSAILNSKISGVEGLVKNISKRIEESQNKRIPIENVANALRATLDIDGF